MYLPKDFADTGRYLSHQGGPPTRFQVFGERSSGTNYVKRLFGRNTHLRASEALGWKHAVPHMTAIPADFLVIGVVRGAHDWALSMHAKPWHCPIEMQQMDFSSFIRAPWATIVDRPRYFPEADQLDLVGQPLQHDRDPATGAVHPDLFALRRSKLTALLGLSHRHSSVAILRMEDVIADPEGTTNWLLNSLDLAAPQQGFKPIQKRLGSRFKPAVKPRPETPAKLSREDLEFLKSRVDEQQEGLLGYEYPS